MTSAKARITYYGRYDMNFTHRRFAAVIFLLAVLACSLFVACTQSDQDNTTDTAAPVTEAPDTQSTVSESDTETASEPVTLPSGTETETEPETESETDTTPAETLPADAPTSGASLTFCDIPLNETILDPGTATKYELVQDEEQGTVLKLTTTRSAKPNIAIDYAAYMDYLGLEPIAWNDCTYAVFLLKLEGVTHNTLEMIAYNKSTDSKVTVDGTTTYKTSEKEWQYVLMPLVDEEHEGHLTSLRLSYVQQKSPVGESVYIKSISFVKTASEALEMMNIDPLKVGETTLKIPGLTHSYKFLHVTDTHVCAVSDEEGASMNQNRYQYLLARRNAFMSDGIYAEDRLPLLFDYADEIDADLLLLTGDLIDFPTETNLSVLFGNVSRVKTRSLFCLGNHDWTFADDYMSANAVATYIPRFNELTDGDPYFSYVEYEDLLVVAIDNSTDVVTQATVDKFFALYEKNKPIILMLHVPFHVDTLEADVRAVWGGRNITMGIGAMGSDWQSVIDLYTSVCLDENTPVVAVIAGHVHFNHEDVFPNGVPQYITSTGYTGDCRVITVCPAD